MSINEKIPECGYGHIWFLLLEALGTQNICYCEIYFLEKTALQALLRNIFYRQSSSESPALLIKKISIILHKMGSRSHMVWKWWFTKCIFIPLTNRLVFSSCWVLVGPSPNYWNICLELDTHKKDHRMKDYWYLYWYVVTESI